MKRVLLAALAWVLLAVPVAAQWQVPDHAVPIGRGSGTGFKSAATATSGHPFVSNGGAADPSFQLLGASGGGTNNAFMQFIGPSGSIKTYTLPNADETIATLNAVQTLTNKTINGANNTLTVREADLSTSDVTTGNVSTTKHGFAPKLPNDATRYLDGTGAYSVPGSSPITQTMFDLFRNPANGVGGNTTTTYQFPGSALTASTIAFYANQGMRLQQARWLVALTPGHASNATRIRVVNFDSGPNNIVSMAEISATGTTPLTGGADITISLLGLINAGVFKQLGYQIAGNGVESPTVYLSTIEMVWGPNPPAYLIPRMTAATTGGFTASASSEFAGDNAAWKAFDWAQGSIWASANVAGPWWLRIDCPSTITPTSYVIWGRGGTGALLSPRNWTLEGSNDGVGWTVVDTRTNITGWQPFAGGPRSFTIAVPQAFSKWRLNISVTELGGNDVAVAEWNMLQ
ncbi:discoidin domain-containing protein [Bradyrhizobium retamae]|uniref:F5/8 type C domain-containing protein n=1 Tax=Bradyrhizobium retamae TaxID=1300035 RepID=A0A0R3MD06_9BRAD|nr:discoidin domain-containing protein [Bradyrhizobium retamae]KRR18136.1 hypothetical protein CQ13_35350 [Bradyrhizobium retamae]